MNTQSLKNISVAAFRSFLTKQGCNHIRTKGGHEVWSRSDLFRPIIFQTHIDPIPEFIIKNNLRVLGLTKKDFFSTL